MFLFDYYNVFVTNKIQNDMKNDIMPMYIKTLKQVVLNTFVYLMPFCVIGGIYDNSNEDTFVMRKCALDLLLSIPMIDVFFFVLHKLFHTKYLYPYHKKHHEITAPIGISALYMSPIDMYFGNILPTVLPAYILHYHPITIKILIFVAVINTIAIAHSGFRNVSEFHDHHHSAFKYNFGTNLFMDRLFGTFKSL